MNSSWLQSLLESQNRLEAGLREIAVVDSEFFGADGDQPHPVCVVIRLLVSGQEHRVFFTPEPPYPACPVKFDGSILFVAFAAQAELMTFLSLGWQMPERILDLDIEWVHLNNEENRRRRLKEEARKAKSEGDLSPLSLLGVCSAHNIRVQDLDHKESMRELILRGYPYTEEEQQQILDYCAEDVSETSQLLEKMWSKIPDLRSAIYRGHSTRAFAWMRSVGIPLDMELFPRLQKHWKCIIAALIAEVKQQFPVFNEDGLDIAPKAFFQFLTEKGWIDGWPKTKGGKKRKNKQPKRDLETLEKMAASYPELKPLATIVSLRSQTKLGIAFPVGKDGRSRVNFWPFGTVTGRCAASNSQFVLGGSAAFRPLVKPAAGYAQVAFDWSAQEFWIAAHLSRDPVMMRVVRAGDPYIAFGHMAGLLPANATKKPENSPYPPEIANKHAEIRSWCKAVALGVLYGKTKFAIARDVGISVDEADKLLKAHRRLFRVYWQWIQGVVGKALFDKRIQTKFGWTRIIASRREREENADENGRHKKVQNSLQNHPMQSTGAEMMRLAACFATNQNLPINAPLHDALYMLTPIENMEENILRMVDCMNRASQVVIGATVPVEVKRIVYPERYMPEDKPVAIKTWQRILALLEQFEGEADEGEKEMAAVA